MKIERTFPVYEFNEFVGYFDYEKIIEMIEQARDDAIEYSKLKFNKNTDVNHVIYAGIEYNTGGTIKSVHLYHGLGKTDREYEEAQKLDHYIFYSIHRKD